VATSIYFVIEMLAAARHRLTVVKRLRLSIRRHAVLSIGAETGLFRRGCSMRTLNSK
jgi:hypothetical protein